MKIFTTYDECQVNPVDERKLLCLWIDNWRSSGFDPVVLNSNWAAKHTNGEEFLEVISKFPSQNPGFDQICFLRWLAVSVAGRAEDICIMADYDCFNFGWAPQLPGKGSNLITLYQGITPSLVSGRFHSFSAICKHFFRYRAKKGETHVSDMLIIQQLMVEKLDRVFELNPAVKTYGEHGWENSSAVHFSPASMQPAGLTPRYLHIPRLRQ